MIDEARSVDASDTTPSANSAQFDILSIAAITVVAAAIAGVTRDLPAGGIVLATIFIPASLLFAIGRRKLSRWKAGSLAVLVPIASTAIGLTLQWIAWGFLLYVTWIPILLSFLTCAVAFLYVGKPRWRVGIRSLCILLSLLIIAWLGYRYSVVRHQWYAMAKLHVAAEYVNSVPAAYGKDYRWNDPEWIEGVRSLVGLRRVKSVWLTELPDAEDLEAIGMLSDVELVSCQDFTVNEQLFKALSRLPKIEAAHFLSCRFECNFRELRSPSIVGIIVSECENVSFEGLGELRSLEGMSIAVKGLDSTFAEEVIKLPELTALVTVAQLSESWIRPIAEEKKRQEDALNNRWLSRWQVGKTRAYEEPLTDDELEVLSIYAQNVSGEQRMMLPKKTSVEQIRALQAKNPLLYIQVGSEVYVQGKKAF